MTKLFISYARTDKTVILPLTQNLQDLGFVVWIDVSGIQGGKTWSTEIVKAITDCDFFLLFISSDSVKSDSVRREVDLAYKNKKNIIPLRLEKIDIPLEWDYQTVGIQWIECAEADWISRLLVALGNKGATLGLMSPPIEKLPKNQEKRVQIIIEGEVIDFNDTRKQDLIAMLAAVLRVDENEIRLLSVKAGSILLEIAIPEIALERLFELARSQDSRFVEKDILSIIFNLGDIDYQNSFLNDPLISINEAQKTLEIKSTQDKEQPKSEKIPEVDFNMLIELFKQVLGERVTDVRANNRLSQSVARLTDPEDTANPELQRVYKFLGKEVEIPKKILELNPSHSILKNLLNLEAGSDLQNIIIEQIYDSALLVEGLHPDPSSVALRAQTILDAVLAHRSR